MKNKISLLISAVVLSVLCLFAFSAAAEENDNNFEKTLNETNTTAAVYYEAYQFSGIEITPALTVYCDGVKLQRDVDFTAEYFDNINVGTAYAIITGIGEYSGTFRKEYPIVPVEETRELKITPQYTCVSYNGRERKPDVTIKYRRDTLVKDKDFKITYSSCINVGEAKITLKGIGNYSFTKTLTYSIVPNAITGLKFSPTTNSVTLSWNKMSGMTGYQILRYDYDKEKYVSAGFVNNVNTTSYTVKGLNPSTLYKFYVRGYKTIGKETYYGIRCDALMTRTRSLGTTMTLAYMTSDGIVAKWNTVRGAGYVLRYATKSDFSNVKEIFITGGYTNSYTIRNVNKNANYYVQITPYTTLNDDKYYSKRSAPLYTQFGKRLAYYETTLPYNPDRTVNVKLACSAINGTVIYPGQTFSFNQVVGKRTYDRGYKNAPVISNGRVIEGIGGGICQVASTMFNAALYADAQIVERHQHALRNTYVPYGRDAAIYWGSQDLRWKNTTSYAIKVYMRVEGNKCICEFYTAGLNPIPSISLNVTQSGNTYTLRRYSSGYCNYVAYTKF